MSHVLIFWHGNSGVGSHSFSSESACQEAADKFVTEMERGRERAGYKVPSEYGSSYGAFCVKDDK